jgi:hypothetical protein
MSKSEKYGNSIVVERDIMCEKGIDKIDWQLTYHRIK